MNQPTSPQTVYNNQRVALGKDLIFSWVVYSENGWTPLSEGDLDELLMVKTLMDGNPIFPAELTSYLQRLIDQERSKSDSLP